MRWRGINYDVGIEYGSEYVSRPSFDPSVTQRELTIIKEGLNCNAVRVSGTDPDRLAVAAEQAAALGLEVWVSPHLHNNSPDDTLSYAVECARSAERLRAETGRVVFIAGCELTIFMTGILPGDSVAERLSDPRKLWQPALRYPCAGPLNDYLARATEAVKAVFHGPLTYASAPFESVDWTPFDIVSLNHYRAARNRGTYANEIKALLPWGRPVVITEVGCCAYQDAEDQGGMGWDIVEWSDSPKLKAPLVRDEALQEREVLDMLTIAEQAGAEGAFVFTFVTPGLPTSADPLHDFDLASFAIVRTSEPGSGDGYQGLPWTPKSLFGGLANHSRQDALPGE